MSASTWIGKSIPSVDLQRVYLEAAQRHLSGRDAQTDWVLREWDYALTGLETNPMLLDDRVDWVAKRKLLDMYREAEGVAWNDDMLHSLDLEYHNVRQEEGLYAELVRGKQLQRFVTDDDIRHAICQPPRDTRAYFRGRTHSTISVSRSVTSSPSDQLRTA